MYSVLERAACIIQLEPQWLDYHTPSKHSGKAVTISTFLTNPSLLHVHNSEIHLHPPVKVVKPDYSLDQPNLRVTWLGHTVHHSQPAAAQRP